MDRGPKMSLESEINECFQDRINECFSTPFDKQPK